MLISWSILCDIKKTVASYAFRPQASIFCVFHEQLMYRILTTKSRVSITNLKPITNFPRKDNYRTENLNRKN